MPVYQSFAFFNCQTREKAFKSFGDDMEEVLDDLEKDLEKDYDEALEDTLIKIEEEVE